MAICGGAYPSWNHRELNACLPLFAGVAALGMGNLKAEGSTFACLCREGERERVGVDGIAPSLDPAMPEVHLGKVQTLRTINSFLCLSQTEMLGQKGSWLEELRAILGQQH